MFKQVSEGDSCDMCGKPAHVLLPTEDPYCWAAACRPCLMRVVEPELRRIAAQKDHDDRAWSASNTQEME